MKQREREIMSVEKRGVTNASPPNVFMYSNLKEEKFLMKTLLTNRR